MCHFWGTISDDSASLSPVISHRLWRSFEHILRTVQFNHTPALTPIRRRSKPGKQNTEKHNVTHWNNFLFLNFAHRSNILMKHDVSEAVLYLGQGSDQRGAPPQIGLLSVTGTNDWVQLYLKCPPHLALSLPEDRSTAGLRKVVCHWKSDDKKSPQKRILCQWATHNRQNPLQVY